MKRLKNFKIQASSLMESVLATAIIAICVVIATIVFVNVFKINYDTTFIEARHTIKAIIVKLQNQSKIEDDTYEFSEYSIEQIVKPHDDYPKIQHIEFTIKTNTRTETFFYLLSKKDELQSEI
ncbi:hypothetical protein C8N46_101687 [Kordia periserrulae]|uniref:Pilin/secretion family protein with methylation motif n=1 Tax=Kordia periserrulae TaxID=701523 RepID=A0A2T6C701_9FLAO|nr:hypothetical protein [Kordia periserrulae]PTX64077.1 hypothetical protein C8N46_101687 [Kordia periserrulae]